MDYVVYPHTLESAFWTNLRNGDQISHTRNQIFDNPKEHGRQVYFDEDEIAHPVKDGLFYRSDVTFADVMVHSTPEQHRYCTTTSKGIRQGRWSHKEMRHHLRNGYFILRSSQSLQKTSLRNMNLFYKTHSTGAGWRYPTYYYPGKDRTINLQQELYIPTSLSRNLSWEDLYYWVLGIRKPNNTSSVVYPNYWIGCR